MFDIGFSELVLIGTLALIVLGPKRLPEVARAAGKALAKLRRFVSGVKEDFNREMHNAEIMELHKLKQELDETRRAFAESGNRLVQGLSDIPSGETHLKAENSIAPPAEPVAEALPAKRTSRKTSASKRRGAGKSATASATMKSSVKIRNGRRAKSAKPR